MFAAVWRVFGECLEGLWRVFGGVLEGVWRVFGGFMEAFGGCLGDCGELKTSGNKKKERRKNITGYHNSLAKVSKTA